MDRNDMIIDLHKCFWKRENSNRPVIMFLSDWVYGPRLLKRSNLNKGLVKKEMIKSDEFFKIYQEINDENYYKFDDKILQVEPLPTVPWMEAIFNCNVYNSGEHMWTEPIIKNISDLDRYLDLKINYEWIDAYFKFMNDLKIKFGDKYAISQTILRGLSDVISALLGGVEFIYYTFDYPEKIHKLFNYCKNGMQKFYKRHNDNIPSYREGYVIGQYYLWCPGKCIRIQEDAVALMSPTMVKEYLLEGIRCIANCSEYTVMHTHITSLHVIDLIANIPEIEAIEIDIDEVGSKISNYIQKIKIIQNLGKCIILKGNFNKEDIDCINNNLNFNGLCILQIYNSIEDIESISKIYNLI